MAPVAILTIIRRAPKWSYYEVSFLLTRIVLLCASLVAQLLKNLPAMWETIPGLGRSPGEGKGYSLHYSGLENSKDCIVHGVEKSWTQLSDLHFLSVLLWKAMINLDGELNISLC